jgi:hypothetical protein
MAGRVGLKFEVACEGCLRLAGPSEFSRRSIDGAAMSLLVVAGGCLLP